MSVANLQGEKQAGRAHVGEAFAIIAAMYRHAKKYEFRHELFPLWLFKEFFRNADGVMPVFFRKSLVNWA